MPRPRKSLISIDATPYYHCVSRCVRRAFLCGIDVYNGQNYEHRRGWVERRILKRGQLFCIDVYAYAVMSNHYHVVLHINSQLQASLSTQQVLERWLTIFKQFAGSLSSIKSATCKMGYQRRPTASLLLT